MVDIQREKILGEIRAEISENRYTRNTLPFLNKMPDNMPMYSSENMSEYCRWIDDAIILAEQRQMDQTKNPLKRVIKSKLFKILNPFFEKQDCVNISLSEAVKMMASYMQEKETEIEELKKKIDELQRNT